MTIRTYLYDATGTDCEVELHSDILTALHDRQLLWIDVLEPSTDELQAIAGLLRLSGESFKRMTRGDERPRLDNYGQYSQLNVNTLLERDGRLRIVQVDFIQAPNIIVSVHKEPVAFLESFRARIKSDTDFGELDSASFLASLLDWHITAYFRLVEELEKEIDRIDSHALRPRHRHDLLADMSRLRQRTALVRRVLTPHREVYAGMARPDFQAVIGHSAAPHYAMLSDRLDRAIEAVENARELLIGSFDMFTTQTTLRGSEVMKVLTLVSFIWFPASVIVGITGLIVRTPVFPNPDPLFWIMIALIVIIAIGTMVFARWRRWI